MRHEGEDRSRFQFDFTTLKVIQGVYKIQITNKMFDEIYKGKI